MHFTKMQGIGNDFIMVEDFKNEVQDKNNLAKELCDRHFGIGADGLIFIENSNIADLKMRIINSDGSNADMCGNGIRCFSKYVYEKNIIKKNTLDIETPAGIMKAELSVENDMVGTVRINMGKPCYDKKLVPFNGELNNKAYSLDIGGKNYEMTTLLMGVPHTVLFSGELSEDNVIQYGRYIEKLPIYPQGTNVNFVNVIDDRTISVRTWERGAGPTLACGTGACASVAASYLNNKTGRKVKAKLMKGELIIEQDVNGYIYMEGPASTVYEGDISI
jgi:diaminopimelate epimerase